MNKQIYLVTLKEFKPVYAGSLKSRSQVFAPDPAIRYMP